MKNVFLLFLLCFCGSLMAQTFSEVANSIGVIGNYGTNNLGGGISFCDFDGDGDDDLTFGTKSTEPVAFYRNDGGAFTKIAAPVAHMGNSKQVLWADYDNDGDKDLFVCDYADRNYLYRNNGGMNFTDVTIAAGLNTIPTQTWGATFGDYDNDGNLDLYVCNRGELNAQDNFMYRNNGDGTFTDVSVATNTQIGVVDPVFCAIFFDYNVDGWQDLYIAVDRIGYPNRLLKNNGDGTFTDASVGSGADIEINAMNSGGGDYDGDGDIDLYVTNTPEGNAFFKNNGDGTFTDVASTNGTFFERVGWGASFFDYDNDTDLDLYVSSMLNNLGPNAMYVNNGAGSFTEPLFATGGLGGADTMASIANTIGDYNNDGLLDIAVSNHLEQPFMIWINQTSNANNFLKVNVEGTISNRDGIGAWVEVYTNGQKQVRLKHCGEAYLGQTSGSLHFGIGTAAQADSVIVRWVGGNVDKWTNISANTTFDAVELQGPLAASLVNFSGQKSRTDAVALNWISTDEDQLMGYELQRSNAGLQYETIHFAEAKGGIGIQKSYSYQDERLLKGRRYYYRLKMIDLDGSFSYSKVITFDVPDTDLTISRIFPNPVDEQVNIEYRLDKHITSTVKVIDVVGQVVLRQKVALQAGGDVLTIKVDHLVPGNYWIKFDGKIEAEEMQFVIPK